MAPITGKAIGMGHYCQEFSCTGCTYVDLFSYRIPMGLFVLSDDLTTRGKVKEDEEININNED